MKVKFQSHPCESILAMELVNNYSHLSVRAAERAREFFARRSQRRPHHGWMEGVFLSTLSMVARGEMLSKVPAEDIQPIPAGSPLLTDYYSFGKKEELYRTVGMEALCGGLLMPIDLAAGMATGFGGGAKAAVHAQMDTRRTESFGVTYLDIKRDNYLRLQRACRHHLVAAVMVSDETRPSVVKSLETFASRRDLKLVLIEEGDSRENIQRAWEKHKNNWEDTIIVPIIVQPSTLYISRDGRSVGSEYMKGHGDFYEVVKSQLRDVAEITGARYFLASNIDNTGALISRVILGYFIEQVQSQNIEAMVEVAEKFEGDKGGTPALVKGAFTILEGPFVPDEWKDAFLGRTVFPYFNANTLWFLSSALFGHEFALPLMTSKIVKEEGQEWLKIESIIGHGLNSLRSTALIIDRGDRFCPAKYLSDLWIGRTDWMRWFRNRLLPVKRDGKYVAKPLVEMGKAVFRNVGDIDRNLFGGGAYDSMVELETMLIGGEGAHFDDTGRLESRCGVRFCGDVAVIFEYREGAPSGTLIIAGTSEADNVTVKDSVIYVPAGRTREIISPVVSQVEPPQAIFERFLSSTATWPASQRQRVLMKFYPQHD